MLAPSFYKGYTIEGDPFKKNNKMYICVKNLNTNNIRTVRFYSREEWKKLWPDAEIPKDDDANDHSTDSYYKPQKDVLGFKRGYITIFRNINNSNQEWLRKTKTMRYAVWWGWYATSLEERLPSNLPHDLIPIRLDWELVGNKDGNLKEVKLVEKAVQACVRRSKSSTFIGA